MLETVFLLHFISDNGTQANPGHLETAVSKYVVWGQPKINQTQTSLTSNICTPGYVPYGFNDLKHCFLP